MVGFGCWGFAKLWYNVLYALTLKPCEICTVKL